MVTGAREEEKVHGSSFSEKKMLKKIFKVQRFLKNVEKRK
jgi:hypothetical protein